MEAKKRTSADNRLIVGSSGGYIGSRHIPFLVKKRRIEMQDITISSAENGFIVRVGDAIGYAVSKSYVATDPEELGSLIEELVSEIVPETKIQGISNE